MHPVGLLLSLCGIISFSLCLLRESVSIFKGIIYSNILCIHFPFNLNINTKSLIYLFFLVYYI